MQGTSLELMVEGQTQYPLIGSLQGKKYTELLIANTAQNYKVKTHSRNFPGDPLVKNPPSNTRDMGLIPS